MNVRSPVSAHRPGVGLDTLTAEVASHDITGSCWLLLCRLGSSGLPVAMASRNRPRSHPPDSCWPRITDIGSERLNASGTQADGHGGLSCRPGRAVAPPKPLGLQALWPADMAAGPDSCWKLCGFCEQTGRRWRPSQGRWDPDHITSPSMAATEPEAANSVCASPAPGAFNPAARASTPAFACGQVSCPDLFSALLRSLPFTRASTCGAACRRRAGAYPSTAHDMVRGELGSGWSRGRAARENEASAP